MGIEAPTRPIPSVLFVCTANQVRSPMAAGLFTAHIQKCCEDWPTWRIESAGTWAALNRPVIPEAMKVLASRGIDLRRHRSRRITPDLMSMFRLILTMEPGHKEALQIEFPSRKERIFMLSEMADECVPVPDPIGGPPEGYEQTLMLIDRFLTEGLNRIQVLARR